MNDRLVLTDELLVRALRQRSDVPVPAGLLARIMAGATGMPQEQASPGWLPVPLSRRFTAVPLPAVAGLTIAIAILVAVIGLRPVLDGPGSSPSALPSPSATPEATTASFPVQTPEAVTLGDHAALRLQLGSDVAPIDVIAAFDSIWIADIHANDVRRYDPATLEELARIPVPGGPAWFVQADGALWVSTQLGDGITRIDPGTNTVVATVGDEPPCAAPFLLDGEIWQAACDGDAYLRIDPRANKVVRRYEAEGHGFLVATDDGFVTSGNDGLARWDADAGTFAPLPAYEGPSGALVVSDGSTVWVLGGSAVLRVDPTDGDTVASLPYPGAGAVTFDEVGRAWLTTSTQGIVEIDPVANSIIQAIPLRDAMVARAAGGFLWVTDFNNSILWRVEP